MGRAGTITGMTGAGGDEATGAAGGGGAGAAGGADGAGDAGGRDGGVGGAAGTGRAGGRASTTGGVPFARGIGSLVEMFPRARRLRSLARPFGKFAPPGIATAGGIAGGGVDGFDWISIGIVVSSAPSGAFCTTKRVRVIGSIARYPSSRSSIEKFENGLVSPRSPRTDCSARCHSPASTQNREALPPEPIAEMSTNHRMSLTRPVGATRGSSPLYRERLGRSTRPPGRTHASRPWYMPRP